MSFDIAANLISQPDFRATDNNWNRENQWEARHFLMTAFYQLEETVMILMPEYKTFLETISFKLFRVPEYQRHYSWQRKQRIDLFEDIERLSEARKKDQSRTHFLATFVCLNTKQQKSSGADDYVIYDVIDGQQRLTTLIILLKAISKALRKDSNEDEAAKLDELLVKKNNMLIILQNNHDSPQILRNYLEHGLEPKLDNITTEASRNLHEAVKDCEAFVSKWENPIDLLRLIKNFIKCIFMELDDEGAAYTIFEVLNSRGLDVDCLDKCKSMMMGALFENAGGRNNVNFGEFQKELHKHWSKIYDLIGLRHIPGDEIVRFAATLAAVSGAGRPLSQDDALQFFKNECMREDDRDLNVKNIIDRTEWLVKIASCLDELYKDKRLQAVTVVTQARLLAVAIKLKEGIDDNQRALLLDQWERTTFKIYGFGRNDARAKVGDYVRLAKRIVGGPRLSFNDMLSAIAAVGQDIDLDKAVDDCLNSRNLYDGWQTELRYFFYRYEEYLSGTQKTGQLAIQEWQDIWNANPNESIEHILPQTMPPNSAQATGWRTIFSDVEHANWVHSIGNLCLVPPSWQPKLSNNEFDVKLGIYQNIKLDLLKEIVQDDNGVQRSIWDKSAIENRRQKLIKFAKDQWKDL